MIFKFIKDLTTNYIHNSIILKNNENFYLFIFKILKKIKNNYYDLNQYFKF